MIKKILPLFFFIVCNIELTAQQTITAVVSEEIANNLEIDIIKAVSKKLNSNLRIKSVPFARRLRNMENGTADITAGLLKSEEREKYIYYIPYPYKLKSNKVFFVRKGDASSITKYEDLYNLTIGTNIKSKYFSRFDNDELIKKEETSSFKQNILKLLAGRVDAVIYSDGYGYLVLKEMKATEKVVPAEYHFEKNNPVYLGISRKSYLMKHLDIVEPVINSMIRNGEIEIIIKNYYRTRNIPVPCYD